MIDKISKGRNVTRLLYYLYGPGKSDEHTDPHLVAGWRDPQEIEPPVRPDGRRDFRKLTTLLNMPLELADRRGQDDSVWHCVLSAAPADKLMSDEQWNAIASEFMDVMGLAPRDDPLGVRWVAVRHGLSKGGIDHVHIVATLARQDGTLPSIHNDFLRARHACRQIERRYGLTVTAPADRTAAVRPTRAETERSARTGTAEPPRITLRRQVQEAAAGALSEDDFFAKLQQNGALVRIRSSDHNPGQATGYAVALPRHVTKSGHPVWFGGGKLANDLALPKLRRRWERVLDPDHMPGRHMSERTVRAFLRSAACSAAERSRNEAEYFTALTEMGISIRHRYSQQNPGELTGYALSVPGNSIWCGGGRLADALTLPQLRRRWSAPVGSIRPPLAPAELRAIWQDILTTSSDAADRMRTLIHTDPAAAADAAWATADLLRVSARVIRGPARQDLRHAAEAFDRAAREAHIVIPRPSPPGDELRTVSRLLHLTRPGSTARKLHVLVMILTDLAAAAVELRDMQRRHSQAGAAITAGTHLTYVIDRLRVAVPVVVHRRPPTQAASADLPVGKPPPDQRTDQRESPVQSGRKRGTNRPRPRTSGP